MGTLEVMHRESLDAQNENTKALNDLSASIKVMVSENALNQKRNDEKIDDAVKVAKNAHNRIDDVREEVRSVADDVKEIQTMRKMEKNPIWVAGATLLALATLAAAVFGIMRIVPGG